MTATTMASAGAGLRLFDAHCHLQDQKIHGIAHSLISAASRLGVQGFVVNGTSEEDWELVKRMSETASMVIPSFGVHPWFSHKCSSKWLSVLRGLLEEVPSAAIGEIGLDKGCRQGKAVDYGTQTEVFKQQLELAKQLQRPVSIHCVSAYPDLQQILQEYGPFPAGIILHSYMGSPEIVKPLSSIGAYFSFSGFLTHLKPEKAKRILKMVPLDRILLETDAPDALPHLPEGSLFWVQGDPAVSEELQKHSEERLEANHRGSETNLNEGTKRDRTLPKRALNHPANIFNVLQYVSYLLDISEEQLAQVCYVNTVHLFSYPGSKLCSSS